MSQPLLITAFGPFRGFDENPSEVLLGKLKHDGPTRVLEVSYKAVDDFIRNELKGSGRILMLGVSAKTKTIKVERFARNQVCGLSDVTGATKSQGKISPNGPDLISTRLFMGWPNKAEGWEASRSAGSYLCNYVYYQALLKKPKWNAGFVHIPPFKTMPIKKQLFALESILQRLNDIE